MDNKAALEQELEKALQHENEGDFNTALSCFNKALGSHPSDRLTIMFEMSRFLFRTGQYAGALDLMIQCHKQGYQIDEIEAIVMEAYYVPNIDEFAQQYHQNVSLLKKYTGCEISDFPAFEELTYKFIPFSEKKYAIFNNDEKIFTTIIDATSQTLDIAFNSKQIYMIKNEYNITNLTALEKQTKQDNINSFSTTLLPLFLLYENKDVFLEHLQILSLAPLLENGRITFLFGLQDTIDYFNRETAVFPNLFIKMEKQDAYYKSVEEAKLDKLKKSEINYQNLMQLFSTSFDTP
jgi:hypothetical protein